jgi:hypothetical protein
MMHYIYHIWLDMPAFEEKTGLMVESNVNLPAFCEFSSYENFKQHVAMKSQLKERNLKVGDLFFIIEDGPQASLTRMKEQLSSTFGRMPSH